MKAPVQSMPSYHLGNLSPAQRQITLLMQVMSQVAPESDSTHDYPPNMVLCVPDRLHLKSQHHGDLRHRIDEVWRAVLVGVVWSKVCQWLAVHCGVMVAPLLLSENIIYATTTHTICTLYIITRYETGSQNDWAFPRGLVFKLWNYLRL